MKRLFFCIAVALLFAFGGKGASMVLGDDYDGPVNTDPAAVKAVVEVIFAPVPNPVAIEDLPKEVQPLATFIQQDSPGCRFRFALGVLTVEPLGADELRARLNPRSDCPNNTIFNVQFIKGDRKKIEPITAAWTRYRHKHKEWSDAAPEIIVTDSGYDVRLKEPDRLSKATP